MQTNSEFSPPTRVVWGSGSPVLTLSDVSLALSNTCVWGGQTKFFYSLAARGVALSKVMADRRFALVALFQPAHHVIPNPALEILAAGLGIPPLNGGDYHSVKMALQSQMATERRDLMPDVSEKAGGVLGVEPHRHQLRTTYGPPIDRLRWLERAAELGLGEAVDVVVQTLIPDSPDATAFESASDIILRLMARASARRVEVVDDPRAVQPAVNPPENHQ